MSFTITRVALVIFLLVASYSYANPRITQITPLLSAPIVINSTPIRFSMVFSEPVFGFEKDDILTNGRVLALSGRGASYTVLIIPTQNQLIIDIIADSVHNIDLRGNEILQPPFVWNLDNSPPPPITNFITRKGWPEFGASVPFYSQPQPIYIQPVSYQPQPEAAREATTAIEPQETSKGRKVRTKFVFNVGAYNDAPDFLNIEGQTAIEPERTDEFTTGIELFHRPNFWKRGLGYFIAAGYQQSSYSSTQLDASASYTALPLEFGLNMYFNDYLSAGLGGIMHFNGEYNHKGNIGEVLAIDEEVTLDVAGGANSFDSGMPGLLVDLSLNYKVYGAALRFVSLPLKEYTNAHEILGNPDFQRTVGSTTNEEVRIHTLNAIESIGLFFQIKV